MTDAEMNWDVLRAEWMRTADAETVIAAAQRQMRAARWNARLGQALEAGIASIALALVGLALHHAANPFEAALGIIVGISICAAWLGRRRIARQDQRSVEASGTDSLRLAAAVRKRQVRLSEFIWLVIVLDLVFLIPWWVIGSRVHSRRITDLGSIETMWLPLLGMLVLAVWSGRLRGRAKRALYRIDSLIRGRQNGAAAS
jgi:hypothetical protein